MIKTIITYVILLIYGLGIMPLSAFGSPSDQNLSGEKTPCFELVSGSWRLVSPRSKCVQLTDPQYRIWVDRLVQLKEKNKIIKSYKETEANYKALDTQWQLSLKTWVLQQKSYESLIKANQEEAKIWREAFLKLQKIKSPKEHWTKSPVLWFTIGALTAAGLTIGVTFAISAATK